MKYAQKPIVVEAIQFTGWNWAGCYQFMSDEVLMFPQEMRKQERITVETPFGPVNASIGDYIVRGANGEYFPCKPDAFEKAYEAAKEKHVATTSTDPEQAIYIQEAGREKLFNDILNKEYDEEYLLSSEYLERVCLGKTYLSDSAYSRLISMLKKEYKEWKKDKEAR